MITKLAKAKDNWFFKILSAAVAVSFISLFGVSGYINSASQNQTIIKVGKKKISQSEFNYHLQKEINNLKNFTTDDFELTDEIRSALIENVLKQLVNDSVLDQAMLKYNIYFPKAFIQQIIFRQPEFQNPANGQFHPELFKRYLSAAGLSEQDYIANVQRTLARKMMVTDLVQTFAVPTVLSEAIHKMDNQRKSFKYTVVSPNNIKIERQITDDELQQYFEDFSETFLVPETRDAQVIFIPNELILQKYATNDNLAKDYFTQHKAELDQPEKREIEQLVFMDKDTAQKAFDAVKQGDTFGIVAKNFKAENSDTPTLGLVAQDELAEDLAEPVFAMSSGEVQLLPVADTWQVVKVKRIVPAKEAIFDEVKPQILEHLANENLYEALREARATIDDAVNGGKSIAEVAEMMGVVPFEIKGIREEELVAKVPGYAKDLATSLDFNEMIYSYGDQEITTAEEFDSGIALAQITHITDAHMPEMNAVKDKIVDLWLVQEKNALAKEVADNIVTDMEDGSDIAVAAKARDLEAFRSQPISRHESFAGLSAAEISELFVADKDAVKVFELQDNTFVIATPFETVNYDDALNKDSLAEVQQRAQQSFFADMARAAEDNYAQDFKIKIDYQKAGFNE